MKESKQPGLEMVGTASCGNEPGSAGSSCRCRPCVFSKLDIFSGEPLSAGLCSPRAATLASVDDSRKGSRAGESRICFSAFGVFPVQDSRPLFIKLHNDPWPPAGADSADGGQRYLHPRPPRHPTEASCLGLHYKSHRSALGLHTEAACHDIYSSQQ